MKDLSGEIVPCLEVGMFIIVWFWLFVLIEMDFLKGADGLLDFDFFDLLIVSFAPVFEYFLN